MTGMGASGLVSLGMNGEVKTCGTSAQRRATIREQFGLDIDEIPEGVVRRVAELTGLDVAAVERMLGRREDDVESEEFLTDAEERDAA